MELLMIENGLNVFGLNIGLMKKLFIMYFYLMKTQLLLMMTLIAIISIIQYCKDTKKNMKITDENTIQSAKLKGENIMFKGMKSILFKKKIYAYENSDGDKGIIIAYTESEARRLF